MKTWQGRIATAADPRFERFASSVEFDKRLARFDVAASRAHAQALTTAGIITTEEAQQLDQALAEIADEMASERFQWRDELEDVHTHVESRLREMLGDVADKLHTGRSRNDQIAADLRLYTLDRIAAAQQAILHVQSALLGLATRYRDDVMPGYTHLQQAQPVSIAQPLLAHLAMLGRDWERLNEIGRRTDRSPLGSAALAGATFPLDRGLLAEKAGLGSPIENSLDAVSDRDFLVEFVFVASLCMTHLSRLAEDVILWSSTEFGYVRLPDAFSTGSSMMPQKKNPDLFELIRGRSALVIGDVTAALALVKGIPMGYDSDLQECKTPLFHAADTLIPSLEVLAAALPELEFDVERAEQTISSYTFATDLADELVRQGVPFREAHGIVAGLVAECVAQGKALTDLTLDELHDASPHCAELPELTPKASISRKQTAGSTSPESIEAQLQQLAGLIASRRG